MTVKNKSADQDDKSADAGGKNANYGNIKHSVILLENDDDDVFVDNFKTAEELVWFSMVEMRYLWCQCNQSS